MRLLPYSPQSVDPTAAPGDIIIALDSESATGADDLIRLLSGERINVATSQSVLKTAPCEPPS